jgi:hypothetical protein
VVIRAWNGPFHASEWAWKSEQVQHGLLSSVASSKFKSKQFMLLCHEYSIGMWVRELPSKDGLHWPWTHGVIPCFTKVPAHSQHCQIQVYSQIMAVVLNEHARLRHLSMPVSSIVALNLSMLLAHTLESILPLICHFMRMVNGLQLRKRGACIEG